jgi:MATE family multidrug resistance protein
MQLKTSYTQILSISVPIILGSAVQNVIALSDSVFLYHRSEEDFAAIGFVSVFYLIIAAIGYGFSKGGQIIIARRMGELSYEGAGKSFVAMCYFELFLAAVMFLLMFFGSPLLFGLMLDSEDIYTKSLEYIKYRSFGVFFSYLGVAFFALYTGVARTNFIIFNTIVLATVNISLNYLLIYGKWGLPEMGIAGAGLASSIAEGVAFVFFIAYMLWDKGLKPLFPRNTVFKFNSENIRNIISISMPLVLQSIIGLGAWLFFFAKVENLGEEELAMTNLIRIVYLLLSVPCWGFASGINTLVSNFIGAQKRIAVFPIVWKTAKLCFAITMLFTIPLVLFPKTILYPILGTADMSLFDQARPIFNILPLILASFSIGAVFYNGLSGTGATSLALRIQFFMALIYVGLIEVSIETWNGDLVMAWLAEGIYWVLILIFCLIYLKTKRWHGLEV